MVCDIVILYMKEFFGKKIEIVNSENISRVNLKYKINWGNVAKLAPFIFICICLVIHMALIIKKLVWVI